MSNFTLNGIDGTNTFGFLAAVGTLRASSEIFGECRMWWTQGPRGWVPTLGVEEDLNEEDFLQRLDTHLKGKIDSLTAQFCKSTDGEVLQKAGLPIGLFIGQLQAVKMDRWESAFWAMYGVETIFDKETNAKKKKKKKKKKAEDKRKAEAEAEDKIEASLLILNRGSGYQYFFPFLMRLIENTHVEHLRSTLFEKWHYEDDASKMNLGKFDPRDNQGTSTMAVSPSKTKTKTMRGAHRLLAEALALFPSFDTGEGLRTTGICIDKDDEVVEMTWPIWECPASLDTVGSMLALKELLEKCPDRNLLSRRGIRAVYRSKRTPSSSNTHMYVFNKAYPV